MLHVAVADSLSYHTQWVGEGRELWFYIFGSYIVFPLKKELTLKYSENNVCFADAD